MPMDRSKYPSNWKDISDSIKARAGWKCERCGLEHGAYIVREKRNREEYRYVSKDFALGFGRLFGIVRVILTVHHVGIPKEDGTPGSPHDKMDNRPENLLALCQRCHLLADQPEHMQASKQTRIRKKHEQRQEAGQETLFD